MLLAIKTNHQRDEDAEYTEWLEKLRWLFFWME